MSTAALASLKSVFDSAARSHPDLMERYVCMLADAPSIDDQIDIMRRGLRETIKD